MATTTTEPKTESKNASTSAPKTELPNPFAAFASALPSMPAMPSFDPAAAWAQGQQAVQTMMTDAQARWQTFAEQVAALEAQVATHAQTAVAGWATLAKDAIAYGQQLSGEARKVAVEAAKKMAVGA